MKSQSTELTFVCPDCGANVPALADRCWMCNRPMQVLAQHDDRMCEVEQQRDSPTADAGCLTFQLSSLMLTIALISVLLGVTRLAPGLGIGLFVLAVPAYVRTISLASRQRAKGKSLDAMEKTSVFLVSTTIVMAVIVSGAIAFVAVCFPVGLGSFAFTSGAGFPIAVLGGLVAGLWVAVKVAGSLGRRL